MTSGKPVPSFPHPALGRSENAIRLQILAAMIAYLLLRIAAKSSRSTLPALRFAELVGQCLFTAKP